MSTYITVTDMFCGAGGSSQGAFSAGAEVKMAANHWQLAIETHNTNYPTVDHDCADVNQVMPSRWPTTTMLWASPECPHHSIASGRKRASKQRSFFDKSNDPAAVRSRATMWDVPRFAEYHDYQAIIVENVVEVRKWRLFDAWLHAMRLLDYDYKLCYFNSQFFGVPQSRDRFYGVFWKTGGKAPDLDYRPKAWCAQCEREVEAVQAWKKIDYHWGRYGPRRQYLYRCPICAEVIQPFYAPAFVAIDWQDQGTRIGDRKRPLKPRTMERIQRGIEEYGHQYLMIETAYTNSQSRRAHPASEPLVTQTARQTLGVTMPLVTSVNYYDDRARPASDPLPTQTTAEKQAITIPPSAIVVLRQHTDHRSPAEPLTTITAGGNNHALLRMPFLAVNYSPGHCRSITQELSCITTIDHHALVVPEPFIVNYYGRSFTIPVGQALSTIPTIAHHGLVQYETPRVEDCCFRMLRPDEIGRGMAFDHDYIVLGNKRQQVRQYGNAVTPPVAQFLFKKVMEVL